MTCSCGRGEERGRGGDDDVRARGKVRPGKTEEWLTEVQERGKEQRSEQGGEEGKEGREDRGWSWTPARTFSWGWRC